MKQYILLNPGPACTTEKVKQAMIDIGDVCPRESEIGDLMERVSNKIKALLTTSTIEYGAILFTSSGTGAVESVISSLPENSKVLNLINGSYGKRIQDMLEVYEIDHTYIDFYDWLIDISLVEDMLKSGNFTHISMIHCETTTGIINNLEEISKLAKKYNCSLVIDAMSSAFGYPIDAKKLGIDFLCCSSNKLVQGMAGVGIVLANKEALKKCKARTVYLDLNSQFEYFEKTRQMRFTPPVQIINALDIALTQLINEGVSNRYSRYQSMNSYIREEMEKLGFRAYLPQEENSIVITSFEEPENFNFTEFHDKLKDLGFVIYPGKKSKGNSFRLANIGDIQLSDVKNFIEAVKEVLIK
jgi:2-aminoethylphosphonate-pyruvate transaminase